jgi:hypothetical protein
MFMDVHNTVHLVTFERAMNVALHYHSIKRKPLRPTEPSGTNSAADSLWILPSKGSKIPSPSSKHLHMLTATNTSIQVTDKYGHEQWQMQYVPLTKHLRQRVPELTPKNPRWQAQFSPAPPAQCICKSRSTP